MTELSRGRALALWRDTDGLMVPYVAVMLPVLVGFALLALDGSRRMSLQTQMQAAADSLALAGARELNKQTGAESRAISAMANAHAATKSPNTLFGAGSSPTIWTTRSFSIPVCLLRATASAAPRRAGMRTPNMSR